MQGNSLEKISRILDIFTLLFRRHGGAGLRGLLLELVKVLVVAIMQTSLTIEGVAAVYHAFRVCLLVGALYEDCRAISVQ